MNFYQYELLAAWPFWMPVFCLWLPNLAVILDLLLGDPRWFPHPVRFIGAALEGLQIPLLRIKRGQRILGLLALLLCMAMFGTITLGLISLPGWAGFACAVYLSYSGLALGCLRREGKAAALAVAGEDLEAGRLAVSMLVSRDVSGLDREGLYKTLAESLSENFNDGFIAPFFWLMLGGPVGLWIYKVVSTADSMWGYKHEPWARIGWAAARLDDLLAWIPARFSALLLFLTGDDIRRVWPGWATMRKEARSMESPNAGWSMAAAAWLHRAGMGGPAVYAGKVKQKPLLGPQDQAWTEEKINSLIMHLTAAGILGVLLLLGLFYILRNTLL